MLRPTQTSTCRGQTDVIGAIRATRALVQPDATVRVFHARAPSPGNDA